MNHMGNTASVAEEDSRPEGQEDSELLELARTGGRGAYGELWARYRTLAVAVARPFAHADAEDIVSDAFEVIWEQLQEGKGPQGSFRGYLLATVRNLAARSHRKLGRVSTGVDLKDQVVGDETLNIEHEEAVRDIKLAFEALPERWRNVLWMLEVEARPRNEVAVTLGLSPNSTTQLLRRAKEGLREAWLSERFAVGADTPESHNASDLPRYVRGGWTPAKRESIRKHLEVCSRCRFREAELRQENAVFGIGIALLPLVGGSMLALEIGQTAAAAPAASVAARLHHRAEEVAYVARGKPLLPAVVAVGVVVAVVAAPFIVSALLTPVSPTDATPQAPERASEQVRSDEDETAEGSVAEDSAEEARDSDPSDDGDASESAPTPEQAQPQEPETAEEPTAQAAAIWPTIEIQGHADGMFAPTVQGNADPTAPIALLVSGTEVSLQTNPDGGWVADLAGVGLSVGTHSVRVRQNIGGEERLSSAVNFAITLPQVSRLSATTNITLGVSGSAGAQVCFFDVSGFTRTVRLDGAGSAQAVFQPPAPGGWQLNFRYCDAARVGPSGGIYVAH